MALKHKDARERWSRWLNMSDGGKTFREIASTEKCHYSTISRGIKRYLELLSIYGDKWNN